MLTAAIRAATWRGTLPAFKKELTADFADARLLVETGRTVRTQSVPYPMRESALAAA